MEVWPERSDFPPCIDGRIDLHLRNVGVTLPQIQTMDISKLACDLHDPIVTPILLTDMSSSTTSVPRYITAPCTALKYLYKDDGEEVHAKLFDFGSREC